MAFAKCYTKIDANVVVDNPQPQAEEVRDT